MADVRQDEVIFGNASFAAIELRGVVYFVPAGAASEVKKMVTEQIIFSPQAPRISQMLLSASSFAVDCANGAVLKPTN